MLSALLLFTAAIVLNIESVQQTLNLTLDAAYVHVFIPVEVLIWIRSVAIVLLIVAHAMRHVQVEQKTEREVLPQQTLILTPELLHELRVLLTQTTVSEEQPETPQIAETSSVTTTQDPHSSEQTIPDESVFLSVSEDERNRVIAAYQQGIPRREICSHLKWGSAKYSTIVKPVLDSYIDQEQRPETK